jgi:predicted dienelactone hydrolase
VAILVAVAAVLTERRMSSALPRPSGALPVGVTTLTLVREASGGIAPGTYEVQVWYPGRKSNDRAPYGTGVPGFKSFVYHRLVRSHAARDVAVAGATERFPVVVYVAGWGGQRTDNTIVAEDLASNGFVVAAISDPSHDDPPAATFAAPADFSSQHAYEATVRLAAARLAYEARRASDVLDELQLLERRDPSGRFTNRLRLTDAGIVGFSFGGAVALEACGRDERFAAAVNIDGWLFDARNARMCPYLLISDKAPFPTQADLSSADLEHRFESILTVADEPLQKAALSYDGYALLVDGATHVDFTDAPAYSPLKWYRRASIDPRRMSNILTRYLLSFFGEYVKGESSPLLVPGATLDPAATLTHAGGSRERRRGSAS